ncbi:hypothetical protein GY21_01605 [Cryobacterium roopkundense]|uniref:Spore protein YkvP/CgeB glycosyl transferase-like domain-containing protein n=1 Tax=Cryobacterium roopkundense TaxID=1001240 RepID=A0A099JVT5_9MICO|nr:hypothetical protein GY21_01605 [Cryobacterium roopkundense]
MIEAADVCSLQLRNLRDGPSAAFHELSTRVAEFKPTIVLLQHPVRSGLDARSLSLLRSVHDFTLVYHEGDPYGRFTHRLPAAARAAAKASDVAMTVGSGQFRRNLERAGAKDVRWAPHRYDPDSFGYFPINADRPYDFVMIANRSTPRFAFRALPGARQRLELVERMQEKFGSRFAIFGAGWEGPSAQGKVPFWQQEEAISSAWISVNWDHYPNEADYFSNRLPISLAAGSIHITGRHPGYREYFTDDLPFLRFADSPEHLVAVAEETLAGTSEDQRLSAIHAGRLWVDARLRADTQLVELLNAGGAQIDEAAGVEARRLDVATLTAH